MGNRRGLTLVELVLVMTLLIIVISVAAPSLGNFFRGRTLDSEARRLLALTHGAQSRAVFEGVPVRLWLDGKQRTYGMEEEAGYAEVDTKAVEFNVDKDLGIEIVMTGLKNVSLKNARSTLTSASSAAARTRALNQRAQARHANLPGIRFLPDGSIDDTSPQIVRIYDRNGDMLCLVQARSRISYEIRNQANQYNNELAP